MTLLFQLDIHTISSNDWQSSYQMKNNHKTESLNPSTGVLSCPEPMNILTVNKAYCIVGMTAQLRNNKDLFRKKFCALKGLSQFFNY